MAAGGGGAWKVAYADFVTAMMAFFLVMWICAQDQKIKKSVADYFSDPLGSPDGYAQKKATRTGSSVDTINTGSVPMEEKNSLGQGRKSYSQKGKSSPVTKRVSDWLAADKEASKYWRKQAEDQREAARWSKAAKEKGNSVEKVAIRALTAQMRAEIRQMLPEKADGIYRDLLDEALQDINWTELAEDLIQP